jgi:hypothetical protein
MAGRRTFKYLLTTSQQFGKRKSALTIQGLLNLCAIDFIDNFDIRCLMQ